MSPTSYWINKGDDMAKILHGAPVIEAMNQNTKNQIADSIQINFLTISFIFFVVSLFSFFTNNIITKSLKYYGENSLIVLGFHIPVLIVYQRIIYSIYGCINNWGGLAVFIATSLPMLAIIPIVKKLFPRFVGLKPTFTIK